MSELLEETHPEYVYVILQGAGIISVGRPIRGNFYCYKLERKHAEVLRQLFETAGNLNSTVAVYLKKHELKWSHRIDRDGREITGESCL